MFARLDAFVVALSVLGGSVALENSHRLDTGAPDDGLVASASTACEDSASDTYRVSRQSGFDSAMVADSSESNDDGADAAPGCPTD
ncbi:MAG TPA: hypothetical protein VGH49_04565 [Xanthobacteraceae bacterium]